VADRIAVMNDGRLMQVAKPAEIYERPNSRWVADFLGEISLIEGWIAEGGQGVATALGMLHIADDAGAKAGDKIALALRPEKLRMSSQRPAGERVNAVAGTIFEIVYRGGISVYKVRLADRSLIKVALANSGARITPPFDLNDLVWLSWPAEAGVVLTG
jgi:putrescine transport system ATP-binding protein